MRIKKVFKVIGAVFLLLAVVCLGYVFMPIVMLMSVVMDNLLGVMFQLTILLVFLALMKLLIQLLTGKALKLPILEKIKQKFQRTAKNP